MAEIILPTSTEMRKATIPFQENFYDQFPFKQGIEKTVSPFSEPVTRAHVTVFALFGYDWRSDLFEPRFGLTENTFKMPKEITIKITQKMAQYNISYPFDTQAMLFLRRLHERFQSEPFSHRSKPTWAAYIDNFIDFFDEGSYQWDGRFNTHYRQTPEPIPTYIHWLLRRKQQVPSHLLGLGEVRPAGYYDASVPTIPRDPRGHARGPKRGRGAVKVLPSDLQEK